MGQYRRSILHRLYLIFVRVADSLLVTCVLNASEFVHYKTKTSLDILDRYFLEVLGSYHKELTKLDLVPY